MHDRPEENTSPVADHERWYAAVGYLLFLCFLSLWKGRQSTYVRFHARQGVLLFLAECAGFALIIIIDRTLGKLPFLGLLLVIICQTALYLLGLLLSVTGFVKALFGERWRMPFFGHYGPRVPLI